MLISKNSDATLEAFLKLMQKLVGNGVVTQRQIIHAYRRLNTDFNDIEIDYPLAMDWLERYVNEASKRNIHKVGMYICFFRQYPVAN